MYDDAKERFKINKIIAQRSNVETLRAMENGSQFYAEPNCGCLFPRSSKFILRGRKGVNGLKAKPLKTKTRDIKFSQNSSSAVKTKAESVSNSNEERHSIHPASLSGYIYPSHCRIVPISPTFNEFHSTPNVAFFQKVVRDA